ncbi:NUDIX hydrolase [Sphingomonas sp.]|uniref:NUDIX domain-containing protein n=1 Tax=Sphingomonas sp. TaxID=28214 RepID=UPI001B1AB68A|nr:NUDIX hydrolase [Sphingomonas sp.]MBO9711269.1 NUDIX hydrolase [Sphingomonas sp.]
MLRLQVAGMLVRDGKVLLCLRSATRRSFPGVWDLPGGHVEPGERQGAALRRELAEELGIEVPEPREPPLTRIVDETLEFSLGLWLLRAWEGIPANRCPEEHAAIGWFTPDEAEALALALPGYRGLLRQAVAQCH